MSWWKILPVFLLLSASPVFASISLSITGIPSSVNIDQAFQVSVSLSCPSGCGDTYLRAVFYPDGTTNYSGYTQNNSGDWINLPGSQATEYFHIDLIYKSIATWSGSLSV